MRKGSWSASIFLKRKFFYLAHFTIFLRVSYNILFHKFYGLQSVPLGNQFYFPIIPSSANTCSLYQMVNNIAIVSGHNLNNFSFLTFQHGESEFNVLGRVGGDADLSCRGRKYAASLARYFNDAGISGLHIWTSEKKRTKQTAQNIKAPKEHLAALNELDAVSNYQQNFFISLSTSLFFLSDHVNVTIPSTLAHTTRYFLW